jgi:hypothetical protein
VSQYTQWNLPALEFEGTWEALVYDDDGDAEEPAAAAAGGAGSSSSSSSSTGGADGGKRARSSEGAGAAADPEGDAGGSLVGSRLKPALLQYAASALLFSDAGVDTSLISWNHVILLHGPPGTGKTSLCKALAHKLAIRLSDRYPSAQLIEINAHSLFSRWFSESGKLVHRLFAHIGELVADEDSLVFLLIDEVESLTAARKAAVSGRCVAWGVSFFARGGGGGCAPSPIHTRPSPPSPLVRSEPSDAVRVVNAVLTAIDSFRTRKNVLLLTTSNVSEAIDVAFVDRADIKALVGPPGTTARYDIIASCVNELVRVGLVRLEASKGSAAAATAKAVAPGARLATAAEVRALARAAAGGPLPLLVAGGPADSMAVDGAGAGAGAAAASASSSSTGSLALLPAVDEAASLALWKTAVAAVNFSGRTLRKLPLQAHAMYVRARVVSGADFGVAMLRGVQAEKTARVGFADV